MSKLSILFSMGFVKQKNGTHINLPKSEDNILTTSINDVNKMTESQFIKFHNKVIDWLKNKVA